MANSIAFFPWVSIDTPLTIGPLRLIPYGRRRLPGKNSAVAQADIDGMLSAYAQRKNLVVKKATLLELGTWCLGDNAEPQVSELFKARELIAFSALARRRLFGDEYCNFDTYALTIQNYGQGSPGTFSFSTRRRDGGTNHLWDSKEFRFLKPLHVETDAKMKIDETLLAALLNADSADKLALDAIIEFNRANTDSQDVPTHTEVVMTKSAFEFLFRIGEKRDELVRALNAVIPKRTGTGIPNGPLAKEWRKRFPNAARPLQSWAQEFCDLRGGAAHGKRRGGDRFVWSEGAHLAFASILFPLLVKRSLTADGFMTLGERDAIELGLIEDYLMHDPFAPRPRTQQGYRHPWSLVYRENVLGEVTRRGLRRHLDEIVDFSHRGSSTAPSKKSNS